MDGSSGTPYQTVQPKDVLKTPKRLPAALKMETCIVPPVMQAATNGGVGNDNVSVHREYPATEGAGGAIKNHILFLMLFM
ncbi:hypothetical protein H7U18_10575 [Klebsiella pneumoniae]|uniref:Uncharacterized protein n=1 Tax=Klebsiella pneumoniae TaxID=573 RepID=A0A923EMI8_KLEPN|nr:hypothetical protein [Klebsiella pneumoniae]